MFKVQWFLLLFIMGVLVMAEEEVKKEVGDQLDEHILDEEIDIVQPEKKIKTIKVETTTEEVLIITDIPEDDIIRALNIDTGVYSTMTYRYINSQNRHTRPQDRCYDDHMRCLISQGPIIIVCAYNSWRTGGRYNFNSICDLHFDNCIRGWRYWRPYAKGDCPALD